jgi:uncharacterized protein (TIGR02302 family)
MFSRPTRARKISNVAVTGRPQLILAKLIVLAEAALRCFARPLALATLFLALAWLGVFAKLYPWAHLAALALFVVSFLDALGRARRAWRAPSPSLAKRRVEEASGLSHRPLDVLEDRPLAAMPEHYTLWQAHVIRAREQARHLRWPRWKTGFAGRDPYRLRYVLLGLLVFGLVSGWGALGGRMIAAINPALGKMPFSNTTIDAWIAPPDYTHLPPIMIATPAGARYQDRVIEVPEGSVLHAHLAEKDGDAPVLEANGESVDFTAEDGRDFGASQILRGGDTIAIRRGWMTLGSWRVRIVPDAAPQIAFTDAPSATERKDTRIAYEAKDDYGVTSVAVRVTPRETLFGISADPIEFPLAVADDKEVKRVDFKDLTAEPWAGMMVDLQLIATDAAGHRAESDKVAFTLPERVFFQPVARALIEERRKLIQNIFDTQVRSEAANLMAGLARQPSSFGGDPVVMMALRAGAVRLVLDRDRSAVLAVKDILWQSAERIEDGTLGVAEKNLRQAQQELADALDRNADEKEIQGLIDRLHQALAQYLAELSTRVASRPAQAEDLGQILGSRTNVLTPGDLERMLDEMKSLSASGARGEAREELSRLRQILENMQTRHPELSEEQKATLERLKALRALAHDQQELLDATFQNAQNGKKGAEDRKLATAQKALLERLRGLIGEAKDADMAHGADAMSRAEETLRQGAAESAMPHQNEALKALQQAEESMLDNLRASLFALPLPGMGQNDPFGREGGDSFARDNGSVHLPDQMETRRVREILDEIQRRAGDLSRPKTERDYIERLLQNF